MQLLSVISLISFIINYLQLQTRTSDGFGLGQSDCAPSQINGILLQLPGYFAKAIIDITAYPNKGQFYNSVSYTFDKHTLKELKRRDAYSIAYQDASFGQKLCRMNYDIHIGSIWGFLGKVLAFLSSLIGASLPVTGFLVWYNRKFKKKSDHKRKGRFESTDAEPAVKSRQTLTVKKNPTLASNP